MRFNYLTAALKKAVLAVTVLLLGVGASFAQQQVNLTAGPTTLTLPDGSVVPMWGYSCGSVVTGSTATCAALNPLAAGWSPVVITVPTGQGLTINLTNNLSFTAGAGTNTVPTSIMIVGQVGGGLGSPMTVPSPTHANQFVTWSTVGNSNGATFNPPTQPNRVQSFGTEVAAGATTALTWGSLRPGTYLLESGTHPSIQVPMGLHGILVVTNAPTGGSAGTAYPGVSYNAEIPLEFGEIDANQNTAVQKAVSTAGFSENNVIGVKDSVSGVNIAPNGGGGTGYSAGDTFTFTGGGGINAQAVVATVDGGGAITAVNITNAGSGYTSIPLVAPANVHGSGAQLTAVLSLAGDICANGAAACYPPAVNYTPLYYTINGAAFNKTNPAASLFNASEGTNTGSVTGSVLVRLVNAGSRMHLPSIVGSQTGKSGVGGFSIIAEDGNLAPGVPKVQSDVFMAAGKTFDVMINAPAACSPGPCTALPIYDRQLSLSGNAIDRDSGMLAYLGVNGAALPNAGVLGAAVARNDTYKNLISGQRFTVSDPSRGVIANDTNVLGVKVLTPPVNGQVTLNENGTFTYVPSANGVAVNLVSGGSGYTAPTVKISAPPAGGTTATATATVGTSGVSAVNVGSGGSGYTAPTVTIGPAPAGGTIATATATAAFSVGTVTVGAGGTGYTAPTVTLDAPIAGGTQAVASATVVSGVITAISVTTPGSGYTSAPNVYISDSSGTGASATSALAAGTGVVASISVTNPGTGYTAPPNVTITDTTGGGASATASLASSNAGVITAINVTYIGSGYTGTPTVTITDTTGTGAGATATIFAGNATSDSFVYQANGNGPTATVTLSPSSIVDSGIACSASTFSANMATYLAVKTPGVLAGCMDGANLPLNVATSSVSALSGSGTGTVIADANGGFTASVSGPGTYVFTFKAQNSLGTLSSATMVTLTFPQGSGLQVTVLDGSDKKTQISDYRWIIEEDRTFYINPNCVTNPPPPGCPTYNNGIVPTLGVNFHTSNMPFVAQGCTGPKSCEAGQTVLGVQSVCDVSNGVCRPDTSGSGVTAVLPSQVALDPTKRYYISVLPGDAADPFYGANSVGHGMGGAPIGIDPNTNVQQKSVTVLTQPSPYPPGNLSVFVFEDDFPLNGEQDGGGGIDVISPNEPGLGQFQIHLWDAMGGNGDFTGQMTYDMFNQPLSNSLDGTLDPMTGLNACPITQAGIGANGTANGKGGITGMIVTCPKYEADGVTLSPLAGQAVIANLMPGRFGVIATPGADRIARGEEWLQTNTLDGQKAHDSFVRVGEPSYFQEFGPAGYHVSVGFANPKIINGRLAGVCNGTDQNITGNCNPGNVLTGKVTGEHLSRTPDERLYSSGSHDTFYWTQCYVSVGDPDGEDFAFTKCAADGTFTLSGLPDGDWRITTFDQWNDQLVDGLSTPVRLGSKTDFCPGAGSAQHVCNMGDIAATQWQTNLYTRTFVDDNKDGISQKSEAGLGFLNVAVRLRDGSLENLLVTDFTGTANFNETFPLFGWYTVETDTTRYKNTGTHVVYDAGGPTDGSVACGQPGYPPCGNSTIGALLANTAEQVSVPLNLRVPGAVYCAVADCTGKSIQLGPGTSDPPTNGGSYLSTGRIDPPWVGVEGWQGFPGQNNFIEFGKEPYAPGENGGIKGHVIYASTRPFDDPQMLVQTQWEPLVPHVTINLYQEGFASDGVTPTLQLVDTTQTTSFDDFAQGFHNVNGTPIPNMSCPGQGASTGVLPDLFFFSLYNQPQYLDLYNNVLHGTGSATALPYNSQFKCYDGMHNWNQIQPAPYDGQYQFPSVTSVDPTTGKPSGTNCKICTANHAADPKDLYYGLPMLPTGKYVVEVVVPAGYELVKEEDKNILIGDNFIAPVTQEFGALGNVFILPDQAAINNNPNNPQNPTQSLGASPENGIVPGFVPEPIWPCVGEARVVPDYISLYPQSKQVSPFAGATRNLCDRKEVTLSDQVGAIAKFYIYTSTHIASKFTGGITDDYTSEFDPFSPQFGEKFAPPDLPVSVKDWTGSEISRVYADHWGAYDGMTYSTWEVNPPNPTGYSPTMMVFCMNDPGPILDTRPGPTQGQMITDPLFTQGYSQFCYELPFMPGTTQYLDTPVVPTSAFAGAGYNNVDCAYPDATPAIASVISSDSPGPWVSAAGTGHTLTINALGDQYVPNYAYSGPSATTAPFNSKTIKRHYGFGATQGKGSVTIGGITAPVTSWSDSQITVTAPNNVPPCAIQQQAVFGGSTANCGQLVITTDGGKQSIDTVTVTIGGKAPTVMLAGQTIQSAIDAAQPGDLVMVPAGTYNELLLLWKPIRLQGVGAASSIINANTHPAGKLTPWRTRIDCLFGLAPNGTPNGYDPSCGASWTGFNPTTNNPQVDRLPLEATVGWDANLNGNLAELLQEPSLMGALEGAGITVLSKGVYFPSNPFDPTLLAGFPVGTILFTSANTSTYCPTSIAGPYTSNFTCNPSSIDGLGITNSSQGGGGIFVHAWGHNLQIANNRVYNNSGTLSGGMSIGQGEFPPNYTQGGTNADPGSCQTSNIAGTQLPYCHNLNVNVHNNYVSLNSSTGDELFSATPAGAGGVSICTGSDYYKFNYNWVCGNLSSGDGGGVGHLGFIYNGDIEHNTILFNQSTNPTIPTNGGGLIVMGTPDVDPPCGANTDADCVPPLGSVGPSDGVGPNLVINANLIMGNAAESGTGGGIAFQNVNGSDVLTFPTDPTKWHAITFTNNIVANNVAGWDGGGVSLLDALNTNIVNNTIMSNVSTASAGMLFTTLGAPLASQLGSNCTVNNATASCPQPAGLVSLPTSAVLNANLPKTVTCPANHYAPGTNANNGTCIQASYPLLANNMFWQNSSYFIGVGAFSPSFQQNVVTLYNSFSGTAAANQTATGSCPAGASYWDIGVRGDSGPGSHDSSITLAPVYSVLTNSSENGFGTNNISSNPTVVSQYCNGSRQPPEACAPNTGCGFAVPPGISDATVPNPIFNLTPVATVDEGNNWINLRWGPLSMTNPTVLGADGNYGGGAPLGNFTPQPNSPVIDYIPSSSPTYSIAPSTDFFGNKRPDVPGAIDIGAVEYQAGGVAILHVSPTSLSFGTSLAPQTVTLYNTGGATATGITWAISGPFAQPGGGGGGTCGATLAGGTSCTINVAFKPTAPGAANGNLTLTASVSVVGSPVALSGTGVLSASLSPATWSATANRGVGPFSAPTQAFTLQNTGNLTLTNILQGQLGGTNPSDWSIVRLLSTCGPAGGGQLLGQTSLAPGTGLGTFCVVTVQFRPLFTEPLNSLSATVSVTDAAGTQSSTLTGTATGAGLISIAPTSGVRGTTVPVTLTGTNLTVATGVNVSGGGVTCTITGTPTSSTLTASCVITRGASLGSRNVTVSYGGGGSSNSVTFTVTGATLAFSGPVPSLNSGGTNTKAGTITVSNTATGGNAGPFTFTTAPGITKVSGPGTFSITGGTCVSGKVVNPGTNCTINVQYVTGGSPANASANVTVTGNGLATASQTSSNFPAN